VARTKPFSRVVLVAAVLAAHAAWAGGMILEGRGARPLGRAGSFVAGADDGGAFVYNPAGLADIDGISILIDGGLVLQRTHYERVDSGGNPQPGVDGNLNFLPFPTAVITWKPRKLPWLTVAGGVWVPYLGLNSYPDNGPQRYSNISLDGSLVVVLELAAAFRLNEHFWLGVGLQNMILQFKSRVQLSACTELNCAPEDPNFDALTVLSAVQGFTPSGVIGATVAYPKIRAGLTLQLPFFVNAEGQVHSRLPPDPFFANASVQGTAASVNFVIPLMLRAGVEYRPLPTLRLELGFDYEAWSMQQYFTIQPHGIYIDGVPGIGKYYLNTLQIVRKLDDSFSLHLGAEYEAIRKKLVIRAGYLFETSATPDNTLSVLTSDGLHNMLTLGIGVKMWGVRFDLGYAHLFTTSRTVTNSISTQLNPIQPSLAVAVGNGKYDIDTDIIAVGLDGRF
jgi:long-chain fatty acid transport protein